MFSVIDLPKEQPTRVYCSLGAACIILDAFYKSFPTNTGPQDPIPPNKKIRLQGLNDENLKYLWTALMIVGPTGRSGFNANTIEIPVYSQFKPKSELKFFGGFKSNSLYFKVFHPILADQQVRYISDESQKPFGHQIPVRHGNNQLQNQVILFLCESLIESYFKFDKETKTISFTQARYLKTLHDIGVVKLAQAFYLLAEDKVWNLNLSGLKASELGEYFALPIINAKKIRSLNLSSNNLADLDAEKLSIILRSIAPSVTHLNLMNNGLFQFEEQELMHIMKNIPKTVVSVSLSRNGLSQEQIDKAMIARFADPVKNLTGTTTFHTNK